MTMKNNKLYHGTNENHEFYENENYIILRVWKEKEWSLHKKENGNYAFLSFHPSASSAANAVNCELAADKQWVKTDKGFVLK